MADNVCIEDIVSYFAQVGYKNGHMVHTIACRADGKYAMDIGAKLAAEHKALLELKDAKVRLYGTLVENRNDGKSYTNELSRNAMILDIERVERL